MKTAMLDQLASRIASIKRRRSPAEAPLELTNAYVDCLFAVGYARVGGSDVAATRYRSAGAALADRLGDPIHAWLIDAFAARVELAATGRATDPFNDELVDRLESLDRASRYKVGRLREVARLLEPEPGWLDAIREFKYKPSAVRRVGRDVETPDARMRRLASALDTELAGALAATAIAEILASTTRLPEPFALECLDRVLDVLGRLSVPCVEVFDEALSIVDRSRRFDWIPRIVESLRVASDRLPADSVALQLHKAGGIYLRVGEASAARALAAELDAFAAVHPVATHVQSIVRSFRTSLAQTSTRETLPEHLRRIRTSALASTTAPYDAALSTVMALADEIINMTDSYGTNSHYCLTVLEVVDALVSAVVDRAVDSTR